MEKLHLLHPSMAAVVGIINSALMKNTKTEFKATSQGITIKMAGFTVVKNAPLDGLSSAIDAGVARAAKQLSS